MPTIRDVARLAGVAPITVSRVINDSGYSSQETRRRVQAAIQELHYVPNSLARSLRSRQTGMLALVLTDITNPFFTTVARGVEDAASDGGFNLILCNTDESEAEQARYVQALLEKQVDGILIVPAHDRADDILAIQRQGVPVVVLDRRLPGLSDANTIGASRIGAADPIGADIVRCDSEGGAYALARLLLDLGHRCMTILSGPADVSTAADRVAGFCRGMAEGGCSPTVLYGEFTIDSGHALTQQVLTAAERPTALFAANNFLAIGALKALAEAGVPVPGEMSLVGFDDLPPSLVVEPFLTVASQPAYEMGRRATELLLARLAGAATGEHREIVLPTQLILRRSTRRLEVAATTAKPACAGCSGV
jgi:LacI family transcriptional regulator